MIGSSAWMFEQWPDKTFSDDRQILSLALLRLHVLLVYRPVGRILKKISRKEGTP
jgi:hypothetical protein